MISGSLHLQAICEYRCKGPETTFCKQNGRFAQWQRGQVLETKTDVITCSKRPAKFFTAQIIIFKQLLTL